MILRSLYRRHPAPLILAFLLSLLAVFVFRSLLSAWDVRILYAVHHNRLGLLDSSLEIFTDLTSYITVSILIVLLCYAGFSRTKGDWQKAIRFFCAFGLAAILSNALKRMIGRQRPFVTHRLVEQLSTGGSPSFPSGHTTEAFAVATILQLLFPRRPFGPIAFIWAALVGYSRIALGVHYPSDVAAAALLGISVSLAVNTLLPKLGKRIAA